MTPEAATSTGGEVLWSPAPDAWTTTRIGAFADAVASRRGLRFHDYQSLWQWSVTDLGAFWEEVWRFFDIKGSPYRTALGDRSMPGATWFPGATLNYAEHALTGAGARDAVVSLSQTRGRVVLTTAELTDQVARARAGLVRAGVGRGDRVAAYLPNITETVVAFLATASLGAVWSSCAPEFGVKAVVDRLRQIEPKVLFAVDGYRYGDKVVDRAADVEEIRAELPSLTLTVMVPYLTVAERGPLAGEMAWADLLAEPGETAFEPVPFDHPLYVLFSSGTTGLPKPIVHGHGGVLLEHLKVLGLHADLGPDDRFFWFSTTGWMMWNLLVSGLLVGSTIVLFDGDPAAPDLGALWRMAGDEALTFFGTSAPFLMAGRKRGVRPGDEADLSRLRAVGSTGAPLPAEGFRWVYEAVAPDVLLNSFSGGTDICSAFVGACPVVPVWAGEISCRYLGAKVEAFDHEGRPVVGEQGELVLTEPMPSMPVGFWGDVDGSRYREAYFDTYPGVWRHGDWITIAERGSLVISGRSDATLNRGGVRLGTSDFYSVVEGFDEVQDSLVVFLEDADGPGTLVLFLALADPDAPLDEVAVRVKGALAHELSPRHVPDEVYQVPEIPRTLSGKKLEVPVKGILQGRAVDDVVSRDALANPASLDLIEDRARARRVATGDRR